MSSAQELFQSEPILWGDFLRFGAAPEDRLYEQIIDQEKLPGLFDEYLDEYNVSTSQQMNLVFFKVRRTRGGRRGGQGVRGGEEEQAVNGGLGWVGSRLAPQAVSHGLCGLTSAARLGPYLRLSGLTTALTI